MLLQQPTLGRLREAPWHLHRPARFQVTRFSEDGIGIILNGQARRRQLFKLGNRCCAGFAQGQGCVSDTSPGHGSAASSSKQQQAAADLGIHSPSDSYSIPGRSIPCGQQPKARLAETTSTAGKDCSHPSAVSEVQDAASALAAHLYVSESSESQAEHIQQQQQQQQQQWLHWQQEAVQRQQRWKQQQKQEQQQQEEARQQWQKQWGSYEELAEDWRELQQRQQQTQRSRQPEVRHHQRQRQGKAGFQAAPQLQGVEVVAPAAPALATPSHSPWGGRGGGMGGGGGGHVPRHLGLKFFTAGAVAAVLVHYVINFVGTLPMVRYFVRRFIWWKGDPGEVELAGEATAGAAAAGEGGGGGGIGKGNGAGPVPRPKGLGPPPGSKSKALMQYSDDGESVEWVNMCWRKMWRVYQRGIERWLADLLQPLFDLLVAEHMVPRFVQRLRILEFTLDHEAPYFSNMRRRTSRKDSDLTGVVDIRYTGGARMVLLIEVGTGKWRIKIPVLVSDLDLECKMWLKLRLAPMAPYIGTLSLAFVGPPNIKVQLSPYGKVRLMRIPVLQAFLTKFFTVDLPGLMVLPKRLEINIPPAVTAVAEAAVGRDAVMRAVASAVLQADALEHALLAALPLGPQGAAGGVSLPESFRGELSVTLHEARELPVWGFPWQSNPYCRLALGNQAVQSRRDVDTSHAGAHREPVWNQEFQFLVEDPSMQTLEIWVRDSPVTGRRDVGYASFPLRSLPSEGTLDIWLPVESSMQGEVSQGLIHLSLSYKSFSDDEGDSGYREAQAFAQILQEQAQGIVDVKSAADASSRAAVAASAAATAVAVTKAAAARAATRLARTARGEPPPSNVSISTVSDDEDDESGGFAGNGRRSDGGGEVAAPAPPSAAAAAAVGPPSPASSSSSSVDLGSLAKAITDTLQQATLEQQHLASLPQGDDDARRREGGGSGAGLGGHTVISEEGITTGVGVGQGPTAEPLPMARLQEITAAMHDMKLEVDQLVYAPRQQEPAAVPDGVERSGQAVEQSSGAADAAGTHGRHTPAEVAAAAAEVAESAAAVADVAATAASSAVTGADALTDAARAFGANGTETEAPRPEEGLQAGEVDSSSRNRHGSSGGGAPDARAEAAVAADAALSAADSAAASAERATSAAAAAAPARSPSVPAAQADASADGDRAARVQPGGAETAAAPPSAPQPSPSPQHRSAPGADTKLAAAEQGAADAAAPPARERRRDRWLRQVTAWVEEGLAKIGVERQEEGGQHREASREGDAASNNGGGASEEGGPVRDVIIPPDLPLDAIAEEVQKTWKAKEVHVETLIQKAMESRRKQSERYWISALALTSAACAVLLSALLYYLMHSS